MFPKWWRFGGARPNMGKPQQTEIQMPEQPVREHNQGVWDAVMFLRQNGYKVREAGRDHFVGDKLLSDGQVILLAHSEGWRG